MRILVTNDDGIHAEGLRSLVDAVSGFGEIAVVAPDVERSACGHGMTLRDPLRVKESSAFDCPAFEVNGLPVDCVNVALSLCFPDGCDLVLSGINVGPNLGFDITYSGTVAAAMEAAINDIKGIAISMSVFADGAPSHLDTGAGWVRDNWPLLLDLPTGERTFWNINVPAIAASEIAGNRFVKTGDRVYEDRVERRDDPWGRPYYWQGGVVVMRPDQHGTDVQAVSEGYVAITPLTVDWTDHAVLTDCEALE